MNKQFTEFLFLFTLAGVLSYFLIGPLFEGFEKGAMIAIAQFSGTAIILKSGEQSK